MATVNHNGETFEIPDEEAERLVRDRKHTAYLNSLREGFKSLHEKMVFVELTNENSDLYMRSNMVPNYGPIFVVFRAQVKKDISPLWMPHFSVRFQEIKPLREFYSILDGLIKSE